MKLSVPRHWRERLSHYRLVGTRCGDCGRYSYPPKPACPYCGSRNVEEVELPRRGRLVSYTVIYSVPEGFKKQAPIIMGLIELENGARVVAPLTDVQPHEVKTGMKLEAVLRRVQTDGEYGMIYYALKFRPPIQG